MPVCTVGLNHKSAPVEVREKLSFTMEDIEKEAPALLSKPYIDEVVILSTCNRTEIYFYSENPESGSVIVKQYLSQRAEISQEELDNYLYFYQEFDAVEHLFRVASGLESMVLGEPQIAGQVKDAFEKAIDIGTAKRVFVNLYRHTLQTVKIVRNETEISKNAVSVPFAAVELVKKIYGKLKGKRALLVGAGEMCELAALHLKENGVDAIDVVNRTFEKAKVLAERYGGNPYPFDSLYSAIEKTDIVLSSTGAKEPVILADRMKEIMKKRNYKSLIMIDIAVPRDIEEKTGDISDIYLFDIDDLEKVVEANKKKREKEAIVAGEIVKERVSEYLKWCKLQDLNPIIASLRQRAEEIRKSELEKSMKKLSAYPEEVRKELDRLSYSIVNKLLHQPITEFKKAAKEEKLENKMIHFFKSLFNID